VPKPFKLALGALLLAVALYVPFGVPDRSWLTPLNFALAAAVGAIGLNILLGFTGQLSLAHPFFLAVGAYGYTYLAGNSDPITSEAAKSERLLALGLPPLVATVVIVVVAGVLGGLLSPLAGRLKGIYLGIATLGLVFLTDHLLQNMKDVTGGFNGRRVPVMDLGFTTLDRCRPKECVVNGIKWGAPEKIWYFGVFIVLVSWVLAHNMMKNRPGRALQAIRDGETAASVMGVNLTRYRAYAFTISAMFAGLSGVLYAISNGNVTPPEFGVDSSVAYLAMVVIGGLGSLGGSIVGAFFVRMLPDIIQRNGKHLPLVAGDNDPTGWKPLALAKIIYGLLIIGLLLREEGGLAGLVRRVFGRRHRPQISPPTAGEPASAASGALATATHP
jgi:branched-chain amino acid transport system permease protein